MPPQSPVSSSINIVFIVVYYPPQRNSAAVQIRDLAVHAYREGHRSMVIVPTPELEKAWAIDEIDGVQVLRLLSPKTQGCGYVRRAIGEILLPLYMWKGLRKSPYANLRWDLIVWYSPTIFFGPFVYFLRKKNRCVAYLILRDIFPEWALDLGLMRKGIAYYFFKSVAYFQYYVADYIGVQTKSNLEYFRGSISLFPKLEVLNNWQTASSNIGSSINLEKTMLQGRKIAVYVGNMGIAQGMDVLLELAASLDDREDIGFIFVGRGSEVLRLKDLSRSLRLTNTLFFDEVDSSEMPGLLAQCFVGLVALDPRHKSHNIPGKFPTYLLSGLPVLATVNPKTDLAEIINEEKVGRAFSEDPLSPMKEFFLELIDDSELYSEMSKRALILANRMFSTDEAFKQITRVA